MKKKYTERQIKWAIDRLIDSPEIKHRYSRVAHEYEAKFGEKIPRQRVRDWWNAFIGKYDVNVNFKFKEKKK